MNTNALILWMPTERPAFIITDWDGNVLEVGGTLSADEVICDLCNALITIRPVPVVWENYAVCLECLDRVMPQWRDVVGEAVVEGWHEQMASE